MTEFEHFFVIYPGSVTLYDASTRTFTADELAVAYGFTEEEWDKWVSVDDFPEGAEGEEYFNYIHLKPRADNIYQNWRQYAMDDGQTVSWGPDFDGSKQYTMETDRMNIYPDEKHEEKLGDSNV